MSLFPVNDCYRVRTVTITMCAEKTLLSLLYLYLYEVLGPGREDLSGQWSVWCSRLLNLP